MLVIQLIFDQLHQDEVKKKITHLYAALYFILSEIPIQIRNQNKFFLLKFSVENYNNKSKQGALLKLKVFLKLNNERCYKDTLQMVEETQ